MFNKLFNRKTKYQKFWDWFTGFEEVLFSGLQEDRQNKPMFGLVRSHITRVHPQLDFEFGINPEKIELVITANGVKSVFSEVQKLVEAAPNLNKWKITAYKQRIAGDTFKIHYGGLELGFEDIFFQYDDSEGKLGVQLNIRNYEENAAYINGTYRLLDALLGEFDVTFNIGFIEWEVLTEEGEKSLLPLIKLRELVDMRKQG